MDFEKYTERSRGFIQSAQGVALRSGHQRLIPEHLLKVLLDDEEGLAANLIRAAGGQPDAALKAVEAELAKLPQVEGSGAGQLHLSPELARLFDSAAKLGRAPCRHGAVFGEEPFVAARAGASAGIVQMQLNEPSRLGSAISMQSPRGQTWSACGSLW